MRTQSRQQLKFQALLAALLPPWVESSVRLHVLASLRACRTPKRVLTPLRFVARTRGYRRRVVASYVFASGLAVVASFV